MTRVVLVACSGLAREVAEAVRASGRDEVVGLVDDDERLWGMSHGGLRVLGGPALLCDLDVSVVLCPGKGASRSAVAARLRDLGIDDERYATVVHPSVHLPMSCTIGSGSVVLAGAVLTADVTVGAHVVVMPLVTLTHDDVVQDFATVCAGVTLGGAVTIGERAYVGAAASVREGCTVGADAVLGMGAVLVRNLPPHETWAGCPAAPIRTSARRHEVNA